MGIAKNSFHQFFFVKSEHYIPAITSRGKWGKGGGKKGKKKGERRRGGGSQGLGKSATNGINQIRTLRCAKTSKTAAFNRRGVRRASIQPKREYKSVTNVLQYSQTARELFFLPSFFFFSNSREKSGGKIIGAPTYLNALQFLTSFVLFFFFK